jgi:hypothetical protein
MGVGLRISLALAGAIGLIACGGQGGSGVPTGKICPSNHDPIPLEPKSVNGTYQKVELEPGPDGINQYPGSFDYNGTEIVYKNKTTGVVIHYVEGKGRDGKWKLGVACARNLKPSTIIPRQEVQTISDISKVTSDGTNPNFTVRKYAIGFSHLDGIIKESEDPDTEPPFESPKKFYDQETTKYFLYKVLPKSDIDFQNRSVIELGSPAETISVIVKLKRKPETIPMDTAEPDDL